MKRIFITITLIISSLYTIGQINERSFYGGVMYKSSGLGIVYQNKLEAQKGFGKQLDIEFSTFHHVQETKTFNSDISNPRAFVFGKLNKAALLKTNYSATYKISQFSDAQRVGIDLIGGGGIILGFLKPVYIDMIYPDPAGYESLVSEKYDPDKHKDKAQIAGYADGRLGWNELNYKVGLSMSFGLGFTWGYFSSYPKRLETGYYLEYFNNGLPVMAYTQNKNLQKGVFIKLLFGKRIQKN